MSVDGHLVGVAKLVTDSRTAMPDFLAATEVLRLVVAGICKDTLVSALSGQVGALRRSLADLQEVSARYGPAVCGAGPAPGSAPALAMAGPEEIGGENVRVVKRALAFLQRHFQEPDLSLAVVAAALGSNPRYLTSRFTKIVGERMHNHLVWLRVGHACRLLLGTESRVKEIAYASGFNGPNRLAVAFRRHVGVSPGRYRRIFAAP
jgi:AraC-like DNA-binding protein